MDIHQQAELVAAATKALTKPDSFLNFGNPQLFVTWGPVIGQHRDSSVRERSNFRVLVRRVEELAENRYALDAVETIPDTAGYRRFTPRDEEIGFDEVFEVARSSHFLVGWMEELNVRILVDPKGPVAPDNITRIFAELVAIMGEAEERGVIDEDDYDELEAEEREEAFFDLVDQINRGSSAYSGMPDVFNNGSAVFRLYQYGVQFLELDSIDDVTEEMVQACLFGLVHDWAYADYEHTYRHQLPLF